MLEIKGVYKTFNPGTVNEKHALNGIDLVLNEGDFVTVIGGNGAGKSTLARALGEKVQCTVTPAGRSGVPFFLARFRRRYALLVGLALSQWDSLKQLRGRRGQEAASEKDLETKP